MIYSVFDWGNGKYRVYQDSKQFAIMSDPKSCAPAYRHAIGVDVNAGLCPVPNDAQFIGWSDVAKGQVSRLAGGVPTSYARSGGGPNLGGLNGYYAEPALGFLGQAADRPLNFSEAIVASTIISIVSGLASAWFFKHVRVPVK